MDSITIGGLTFRWADDHLNSYNPKRATSAGCSGNGTLARFPLWE